MTRSLEELRQYLAGEWLFENDFKDTSGNGNQGTPNDIEWASTLRGLKPRFNGSSSHVSFPHSTNFDIVDEITLSVSFNAKTRGQSDGGRLISHGTASQYELHVGPNNSISFLIGNNQHVSDNGIFQLGEISNVSVTYNKSIGEITFYKNGVHFGGTRNESDQIGISTDSVIIGNNKFNARSFDGCIYNTYIFNIALTSTEMLMFYNATSGEYGVRIAEFSYQHDPAAVIPAQTGEVLRIGGKLAGDAVDTISDRALSNDATIHGAMPTDGFLAGGRRFVAANNNYLDCGNDSSLDVETVGLIALFNKNDNNDNEFLFGKYDFPNKFGFRLYLAGGVTPTFIFGDGAQHSVEGQTITPNKFNLIEATFDGAEMVVNVNGVQGTPVEYTGSISPVINPLKLVSNVSGGQRFDGICVFFGIAEGDGGCFNALAVLPFWSINYRDYPDNVTTYTDRFPHSSSIIASGAFKIDDDKLTCTSAGTLTYSASHEFDGAEYITVTIAGTEYSGTGTITQGNTTVSVAQGSNKITVVMGTGDTIDKIKIQFRATV